MVNTLAPSGGHAKPVANKVKRTALHCLATPDVGSCAETNAKDGEHTCPVRGPCQASANKVKRTALHCLATPDVGSGAETNEVRIFSFTGVSRPRR